MGVMNLEESMSSTGYDGSARTANFDIDPTSTSYRAVGGAPEVAISLPGRPLDDSPTPSRESAWCYTCNESYPVEQIRDLMTGLSDSPRV